MKKVLVAAGVLVVGIVAAVLVSAITRKHVVAIDVTGTPGTKFTGSCSAGDRAFDISGVVPSHRSIEADDVSFVIELPDADVSVELDVPGFGNGKTHAGSPAPTYVTGEAHFTMFSAEWHVVGSNRPPQKR